MHNKYKDKHKSLFHQMIWFLYNHLLALYSFMQALESVFLV